MRSHGFTLPLLIRQEGISMPNEVIRQLKERKSVRVFTDEPIHEDIIQEILLAAVHAPTV